MVVVIGQRADGKGSVSGKGLVNTGDVVVGVSATFDGMWDAGGSVRGIVHAVQSRNGKEVSMTLQRQVHCDYIVEESEEAILELCEEYGKLRRVGSGERVKEVILELVEDICRDAMGRLRGEVGARRIEWVVRYVKGKWDIDLGERVWNVVMSGLIRCKAAGKALKAFEEIEEPNVDCYTTYIKALGAVGRSGDALGVLKEMREVGVEPGVWTYNAVISVFVRDGRLDRAWVLFSEMVLAGIQPDTVSWNIIMNWHMREKRGMERVEGVVKAFEDMKESGVKPDVISYSTVMKAYAMSGLMGKADAILEEMCENNEIEVDAAAYNSLLESYAERHDWRRCMELLSEMKRRYEAGRIEGSEGKESEDEEEEGVTIESRPNPWRVSNGIKSKGGRALKKWEGELKHGPRSGSKRRSGPAPNELTYCLTIKACSSADRVDKAEEVFREMVDAGMKPPPVQAIMSLVGAYSRAGMLKKCYGIMQELNEWKMEVDGKFLSALMSCCVRNKSATLALGVYAKMKSMGIKADQQTYTSLMRAYCLQGEFGRVVNILKSMRKDGERLSIVTYNVLIEQCVGQGETDQALYILGYALRDANVRPNWYTMASLVQAKDMEPTEKQVNFLLSATKMLKERGRWASGLVYAVLIEACSKCGQWEIGRHVMRNREEMGFRVSSGEKAEVREAERKFEVAERGSRVSVL